MSTGKGRPPSMYACICNAVTEDEVRGCVMHDGATCVEEVGDLTGAGTGCGTCLDRLDGIVAAARAGSPEHCPLRMLAGLGRTA